MTCPKCSGEMAVVLAEGRRVQRCSQCQGLWFTPEDLAALRQDEWMADYILDQGKASTGRKYNRLTGIACPECGTHMKQEKDEDQPHILYEVCPQGHGYFFDAGEFTDLVHKTFWDKLKPAK